jgi:MFS family permease
MIVRLVLVEPRSVSPSSRASSQPERVGETVRALRTRRTFVWVLAGTTLYSVFAYGMNSFLPSFMIRSLGATLSEVSLTWGFIMAAATLIGALGGGWLADNLNRRDVRWLVWLPTITCVSGAVLYAAAFFAHSLWTFIGFEFFAELALGIGVPVSFAAVHAVCGNTRRAIATAAVYFSITLFGGGLGPLLVGVLSDATHTSRGSDSLRYALIATTLFLVPAALAYHRAGYSIVEDQQP